MADIQLAYRPFPVHQPVHQSSVREKAMFGSVGSGKTLALCGDAIMLGLAQPGSRILVARQTVPSLRDTTEREFVGLINTIPDDLDGIQKTTLFEQCEIRREAGHIRSIMFPNGTEYLFRGLDDYNRLMSLNLAAFYVDEAHEIDANTYLALLTRLRQNQPTPEAKRLGVKWDPYHIRQHAVIAMNPNGHDWAWDYFVNTSDSDRRYWRSSSFDNPTLYLPDGRPSKFLENLMTFPEQWIRRYVLAEFDTFEGQILSFDYERHVKQHFNPPPDWERAMGFDWGLRNPAAAVWWARPVGTRKWFQYREFVSHNPFDRHERELAGTMTVPQVASRIRALERGEKIKWRAADPAIRNRGHEHGKSVAHYLAEQGLYFQYGLRDYTSRINALNHLLVSDELELSTECPVTAMMFQQYHWRKLSAQRDSDGPERPAKKDDHLVDAAQYLATIFSQGFVPEAKQTEKTWNDVVWDKINDAYKRSNRKRHPQMGPGT
jgi:PBSX family phage terminase large subunit